MRSARFLVAALFLALPIFVSAADEFVSLQPDQPIADFRTEAVYDNESGHVVGARFRHVPSGFVLDLLRIQSLPQAFMWVNSPPPSDQGEPHTLEHLLLGKGNKGRYVASLEDMSLGSSSAFTMQVQTCYHFNAPTPEIFFNLLEAKMDAMVHPNYSDEEIRREVANMGVAENQSDGSLRLEEKGTVYNEMTRSFESPWGNLSVTMDRMIWGAGHPLSFSSGGYPDSIRNMTPDDLRAFHGATHHLNNMGAEVALPDAISLDDALTQISSILKRIEPEAKTGDHPSALYDRLPAAKSAPYGTIAITEFPHADENEPGLLLMSWPPIEKVDNNELYLLELLMNNLANGPSSNLYKRFIDSRTRTIDIGASGTFVWVGNEPGHPVQMGFGDINRASNNEKMIDSVRSAVISEIAQIAALKDGSPELKDFNDRALNRIAQRRRTLRQFLNSPPGWGARGTGSEWMEHLRRLHYSGGFHRSLVLANELAFADSLVNQPANIWREYINRWQLLTVKPYAVSAKASPQLLARQEAARQARIDAYADKLMKEYGVSDRSEAIKRFSADYDRNTAAIDAEATRITMPAFAHNPPMTLDDQLKYRVDTLPGGAPLVASTFENMSGATMGFAFRMDVVPESLLVYVSALPDLLTSIGGTYKGQLLAYDKMSEAVRKEILRLSTYYSVNYRKERVELVCRAAGSDSVEAQRAVDWINTALFGANFSVENLPRIRDVIDQTLMDIRSRTASAEESWVDEPANGYWKQDDPLILAADNFLTRAHAFHRLRWLLKESGSPTLGDQFSKFMDELAPLGANYTRDTILLVLGYLKTDTTEKALLPEADRLRKLMAAAREDTRGVIEDALSDLERLLSDIPDNSLGADWRYLCRQMTLDFLTPAREALDQLQAVLALVRRSDNVRSFVVGSTATQKALRPRLDEIVSRLDTAPSKRATYAAGERINNRLKERAKNSTPPIYVGLVNNSTRSGVIFNTADCASYADTSKDVLIRFLSARLYGGGGAHSMFMKTWGAGLAYSNGLRSNEASGRLIYYAERCPDLSQTMQFVVDQLKNAPRDTALAEYAVSQAFVMLRGGASYEARGEAMANDLADGITPDVVRSFRQRILDLRKDPKLYDKLAAQMESIYGLVLPDYGPSGEEAAKTAHAMNFIIGPEKQFQTYEQYLDKTEGDIELQRLYPRDYWLPRTLPKTSR